MKSAALKPGKVVLNARGRPYSVLLDLKTYQSLLDIAERFDDLAAYDRAAPEAHAEVARGEVMTIDEYLQRRRCR